MNFSHYTRNIDTNYIHAQYRRILALFNMMGIDNKQLLRGMDNVEKECTAIELLA